MSAATSTAPVDAPTHRPAGQARSRAASSRTVPQAVVDALCLLGTLVVALVPLLAVHGGTVALPALVGGALVGAGVVALGAWRSWPALGVVAALVVAYGLVGGALAAPQETAGGLLPTLGTVRALAAGAAGTWKQVLTLQPPVGSSGTLLVAVLLLALVGSATALALTLRVHRPAAAASAAVVPPVVAVGAIVLGTRVPTVPPVVTGLVLLVVLLPWAAWRSGTLRAVRRPVAAGVLAVAALAGALLGGPAVVGGTERFVVRDEIVPPFDPRDYPSPLAAFREYVKQDDTPLLTVTGLPEGARVRLATMDRYDGVVWNVAGDGSAQASGEFRRVGDRVQAAPAGQEAHVEVQVEGLGGVWLPTVGEPTAFHLPGTRSAELRFNDATDGAVLTQGVTTGLRYALDVVVPAVPSDDEVGPAPVGDVRLPELTGVPDVVAVTAADVARDAGSPVQIARALARWLSETGFFSHGITEAGDYPSLSGHGAARLTTLLDGDLMVGDGEQYAAAMALMAREMGLPARVVLGFVPPADAPADEPVTLTGADVQAWVEVDFAGYGWVPFDPTPPPAQTPQDTQQETPARSDPQVVQPPPPPPAVVTPPDEDTEQPQADDPGRDDGAAAVWLRVLRVAGVAAIPLVVLVAPFVVVAALKARRRRRRRTHPDPVLRVAGGWDEVLDAARDLRHHPAPGATRLESARSLAEAFGVDGAHGPRAGAAAPEEHRAVVSATVGTLARSADRAVFAGGTPSVEQVEAYWSDVEVAVAAMARGTSRGRRLRARVSTASLRRTTPARDGATGRSPVSPRRGRATGQEGSG